MPNGGARPGAGRKQGYKAPHTLEAETYRKILIQKIVAKAGPLADALVSKGLTGDVQALKEINERALGKVKDNIDLTSKGKEIKAINYIVPHGSDAQADPQATPGE